MEAVQVIADLDLSVKKAYFSYDGRWFMDVFHITDRFGRKLTDESVLSCLEQVWTSSALFENSIFHDPILMSLIWNKNPVFRYGECREQGIPRRQGKAHGAGVDRQRPPRPSLRGLRRACRPQLRRGRGHRVDPPRSHRVPSRRQRRALRRVGGRRAAPPPGRIAPPASPPWRPRRRQSLHGGHLLCISRQRRPPSPPAVARRPRLRARLSGGGCCRLYPELGRARLLGRQRAVPRAAEASIRRPLRSDGHGVRRVPRRRRHRRRFSSSGSVFSLSKSINRDQNPIFLS